MHTTAHNRTAVADDAAAAAPVWQRRSGLQRRHRGQQCLQDGGQSRVGQLRNSVSILLHISEFRVQAAITSASAGQGTMAGHI